LFQLKEKYGERWRTFVDNTGAIQAFGFANMFGVEEWGKFFSRSPEQLLSMSPSDQLLYISGKGAFKWGRMNHLVDDEPDRYLSTSIFLQIDASVKCRQKESN